MEMFYPSPRLRMIRERLLFLATRRYGLTEEQAENLVDGYIRGDSEIDTEKALGEIRRTGAFQAGPLTRTGRLVTSEGLDVLRRIRQQQVTS
jgi:hypothetical protein